MRLPVAILIAAISLMSSSCHSQWQVEPSSVRIILSENEPAPLALAVKTMAADFSKVTGISPEISTEPVPGCVNVIVRNRESLGEEELQNLRPLDGFESHALYSDRQQGVIYLDGMDMRGAIYAVYTFSEKVLGVPPLWYWASWTPERLKVLSIPEDIFFKSPQVRYRSWLPNDSDLWTPWTRKSEANAEAIYETMLRLKLNTLECGGLAYPGIPRGMQLCHKFGLVVTSHHIYMLNTTFSNWAKYCTRIKGLKKVPELSVKDTKSLEEFWEYGARTVVESGVENIWNISFRGSGDQPFWILFKDAPESEEERAKVINEMLERQVRIIRKYSKEEHPYIRMTFYDEMADLVTSGLVTPPVDENMIWTFCSGRRDHYPYTDIQNFNPETPVKLGYYMNLQFTSTGAHLSPAEGPWKMEFNYRYLNGKSPLYLSVVNSGNFREFLYTMTANARMLWDMDSYSTDEWNREYAAQYFSEKYASQIAALYKDYFYSFWNQKKSDFPGGMERQFVFQDQRHSRAIFYIAEDFFNYNPNPLPDRFGYERVPGRVFRVTPEDCGCENQVDAMIKGMTESSASFADVTARARKMMARLPREKRQFFYDNLVCYSSFMQHLSETLLHFVTAYKMQEDASVIGPELDKAYDSMLEAIAALEKSQTGVFSDWYAPDRIFKLKGVLSDIDRVRNQIKK